MMAFTAPSERESQVGYFRVRFLSKRFRFFNPNHVIISLSSYFLLMMDFNFLTMFCFSATFVDKRHVAPRLSLTNVKAFNYLLRSEIFVSEDRQLRAVHLILDFEPISKIYQEIGHAIRAGEQRLAQIDVSRPNFLAQDDLPLVVLPLQRVPPEAAAAPEEEIASSRLSLKEEIDKFHFKEEENPGALVVNILDTEDETDRNSGVHAPTLVIAHPDNTSQEEEDGMALNWGSKSLRDLMAARYKVSTSKEATKSQIPHTLPPPPPPPPTDLGLKVILDVKKKRPIQELEEGEVGPQIGTK